MFFVFALPCLSCFPFGFVGGFFLLCQVGGGNGGTYEGDTYEGDTYGLWQTEDCMKWGCIRFFR